MHLPVEYLMHIKVESEFLVNSFSSITKDEFLRDEIKKRAAVRSLEIIGEASKKISADIKLKWNQIEWKQISGMRDKLIHDYMGVNYRIVWDVIKNKIPQILPYIIDIIEGEVK